MPEAVSRTQRGNTVIVWFYTYNEDEQLSDCDELPTVEVYRDGLRVLGPFTMTHYGIGVYRYELHTEAMSRGTYRIVCRGTILGKGVVQDAPLTVEEPWA